MIPNVLFIGPPKTGTTSLYAHFISHPEVSTSGVKETLYYIRDYDSPEYRLSMSYAESEVAADFQPKHCLFSYVPPRVVNTSGEDTKIVMTIREPIARMYSEMCHFKRMRPGRIQNEDLNALAIENMRIFNPDPFKFEGDFMMQADKHGGNYMPTYLEFSCYRNHYHRWKHFNIHFVLFDDLFLSGREASDIAMGELSEFMDVEFLPIDTASKINSKTIGPGFTPEVHKLLRAFFKPHVDWLSNMTGRDLNKLWYSE